MHASGQDRNGAPRRRTRAQGPRRHPRSITATNSEWQRVTARANQAGMPIGRYLVGLALNTPNEPEMDAPAPPANTLPDDLQWELAERLLVTAAVIEARLAGTAWEAEINSIRARVRHKLQLANVLR